MILLKRVSLIPLYGYLNIRVHLKHGNKQLIEASILHAADRAKPFLLSTDARGVGIGAVLQQDSEKGIVPVAKEVEAVHVKENMKSQSWNRTGLLM